MASRGMKQAFCVVGFGARQLNKERILYLGCNKPQRSHIIVLILCSKRRVPATFNGSNQPQGQSQFSAHFLPIFSQKDIKHPYSTPKSWLSCPSFLHR